MGGRSLLRLRSLGPPLALAALVLLAFAPSLQVFLTPEFVRHYWPVVCQGERPGLWLVAEELSTFGKPRPLGSLAHVGLLAAFRDLPALYKLVHLAVVWASAVLLWRVVGGWEGRGVGFLTAALFLFLPPGLTAVSTVHLMTMERHLAMVFLCASALALRRARVSPPWLLASGLMYLAAVLCKESVVLMPVGLLAAQGFERTPRRFALPSALAVFGVTFGCWVAARWALAHWLPYGIPPSDSGLVVPFVLRSLGQAGRLMVGIPTRWPGWWLSVVCWAWVLVLLLVHGKRWPVGLIWIVAALLPHLHLRYQGPNYVYFAMPMVCFSLAKAVTWVCGGSRRALRIGVWTLVVAALAVWNHWLTQREAAPHAVMAQVRAWLVARGVAPHSALVVQVSRDPEAIGKSAVIACGTGLRPQRVRVVPWSRPAPEGAAVGYAMGMWWRAWLKPVSPPPPPPAQGGGTRSGSEPPGPSSPGARADPRPHSP